MRTDENNCPCPETLGEYLNVCYLGVPNNKAVKFLKDKIAQTLNGENEKVSVPDIQMRTLLFPLIIETEG